MLGVKKFVLVSYFNVRPNVKSEYHTTKWQGEEIVRASKLNFTILKAGLVYGQGDHLIHNLSNLFRKMPVFAAVGLREKNGPSGSDGGSGGRHPGCCWMKITSRAKR